MTRRESAILEGSPPPFPEHYEGTVGELQASWSDLLSAMGAGAERPLHLSRRLGLSSTLSWHLSKMLQAMSASEAVQFIPGVQGRNRILEACSQHGAPQPALDRATEAHRAFEEMITIHAGDRRTLDAMHLGDELPPDNKQREQLRRQGFLSNSANCGVQARARVGTMLLTPSEREGFQTVAAIGGLLDFRRLSAQVSWPASYLRGPYKVEDVAASPDKQARSMHLLKEFSTIPDSDLRAQQEDDGVSFWLENTKVGLSGSASYFVRVVQESDTSEGYVDLKTPVEVLVFSMLFHRDLDPIEADPFIFNRMQGSIALPLHAHRNLHLPIRPTLERFENAARGVNTPIIPRHREMVEDTCDLMDWNLDDFSGYRMILKYPPIPTLPGIHWTRG